MAKKVKKQKRSVETAAIPSADNAKWMGIGFVTAVVLVSLGFLILTQM